MGLGHEAQSHFIPVTWINGKLGGRLARRICAALLVLLVLITTVVRIHGILLTRRIDAVLRGLEQVQVDQTTEAQLLKAVPYLTRNDEHQFGSSVDRSYRAEISNSSQRRWLWWLAGTRLCRFFWPWYVIEGPEKYPKTYVSFPLTVAYWLGWRDIVFVAQISFLNGRLFAIWYAIEPDIERIGPTRSYFVSVHGIEEFRASLPGFPVSVSSTHDESPAYRVGGTETSFGVKYLPDAPRQLVSHAFQLDLGCYWNLRGCTSAADVAPRLWRDTQAIEAQTYSRFHGGGNPCPDRILANRVRYLPDLNVEILEVTGSRSEHTDEKGQAREVLITDYRVKEVLLGHSVGPWSGIRYQKFVPSPLSPYELMANPVPPFQVGEKVLAFGGAKFDSCQMVQATPSAELAVRTAIIALNRREDGL